jgi:hypothetical protein
MGDRAGHTEVEVEDTVANLIVRLALAVACIMGVAWGAILCQENHGIGAFLLVPGVVVVAGAFITGHKDYFL